MKVKALILLALCVVPLAAAQPPTVDVVDLRGADLKARLLMLSLEGIVNREGPRLYVLWESVRVKFPASERWLEYYRRKGWISGYRLVGFWEAVEKYRHYVKGAVVYDPALPATINVAASLAGVEDLVIAHPDYVPKLNELGIEVKIDLRGRFRSSREAHEWQLEHVFPRCNKSLLYYFPTMREVAIYRVSLLDYAVSYRACSIGLRLTADKDLIGRYYEGLEKFALVIGYPERAKLERPWVEYTSKYGLLNVLGTGLAPNLSFHSRIPARRRFEQEHRKLEPKPGKIYIAFAVTDLGLNSMQDFYYEMWLSHSRGKVPISWWLDPITADICPGIVQYYYETKTPNDYFYSAHVGGRIRPSDFPYLEEYLERGQEYLDRCSLRVVAFSNHNLRDDRVLKLYSEKLDIEGFVFGFGPEFEDEYWLVGDKVWVIPRFVGSPGAAYLAVKGYIETHPERPLFIVVGIGLWHYPTVEQVIWLKERLQEDYGDQAVFCRLDELVSAAKSYAQRARRPRDHLPLLPILIALLALAAVAALFYLCRRRMLAAEA